MSPVDSLTTYYYTVFGYDLNIKEKLDSIRTLSSQRMGLPGNIFSLADLGGLHAVNDAAQVQKTFLCHENFLVAFNSGERFCKEICVYLACDHRWLLETVSLVII